MHVGDDRFALLQIGGSEPVNRQHDEGRTDEAEEHKDDKNTCGGSGPLKGNFRVLKGSH